MKNIKVIIISFLVCFAVFSLVCFGALKLSIYKATNTKLPKENKYYEQKYIECLKMLNIDIKNISNLKIERVKNISLNKDEIKMSNETFTVSIDSKTEDLVAYNAVVTSFPKSTATVEEARKIANEIYDNLKIENKQEYKLANISQFDEELWIVDYLKEYEKVKNPGEKITFSFSPQTKEIYNLVILRDKFAGNKVKITEEKALKIAKKKMQKNDMQKVKEIKLDIVKPNNYFSKTLNITKKNMRKAYVVIFENGIEIYVDVTNGKIIGGDVIL